MAFELGDPVRIEMTKWGDRPHWQLDATWLGSDQQGEWLGIPAGTTMSRPGFALVSKNDQVGLVPPPDRPAEDRGWLATFHAAPRGSVAVYVDITTPPFWDGATVRTVDLDLDVVRFVDGALIVDDEDEFAQHQVDLGYPDDVVRSARLSCERVHAAMTAGSAPYDGSHEPWQAVLREITART